MSQQMEVVEDGTLRKTQGRKPQDLKVLSPEEQVQKHEHRRLKERQWYYLRKLKNIHEPDPSPVVLKVVSPDSIVPDG